MSVSVFFVFVVVVVVVVGQKGIGFKSVFRITDRPEVHSNGYHICFDAKNGPIGLILPQWVKEKDLKEGVHEIHSADNALEEAEKKSTEDEASSSEDDFSG